MMKRIENEDTGNWIKFKATESKIVIFSETQKIIAEGAFPSEKIEVFEKRVARELMITLMKNFFLTVMLLRQQLKYFQKFLCKE